MAGGNLYYDLFLDNQRQQKSPDSGEKQNSRLPGDSMPGFDGTFAGALIPQFRSASGISEESIAEGGGNVNLFILEVTDMKTGKRLPEYEDELTDDDTDQRHNDTNGKAEGVFRRPPDLSNLVETDWVAVTAGEPIIISQA
jgi:hypothetical protein